MTRTEKLAMARAFHRAAMTGYPPQAQAWIRQQFNACVNNMIDALLPVDDERRQMRALIDRDNWTGDNPFRDDT